MKKTNKILRIVVSVLLCLTLISSCVLSSIFAKYTTQRERGFTAVIEKFGVTVEVSTPISDLTAEQKKELGLKNVTVTNNAGSNDAKSGIYTITISNLPIRPGIGYDTKNTSISEKLRIYSELVKFEFSGTANVPLTVSIETDIAYANLNLTVPADVCGKDNDTKYLPIGFNCFAYNGDKLVGNPELMGTAWRVGNNDTTSDNRSQNIASNFKNKYGFTWKSPNKYATKNFKVNEDIVFYRGSISTPINAFSQGIYWPLNSHNSNSEVSDALGNKIDTWLMETNENATITLTYTVKVEQTGAA